MSSKHQRKSSGWWRRNRNKSDDIDAGKVKHIDGLSTKQQRKNFSGSFNSSSKHSHASHPSDVSLTLSKNDKDILYVPISKENKSDNNENVSLNYSKNDDNPEYLKNELKTILTQYKKTQNELNEMREQNEINESSMKNTIDKLKKIGEELMMKEQECNDLKNGLYLLNNKLNKTTFNNNNLKLRQLPIHIRHKVGLFLKKYLGIILCTVHLYIIRYSFMHIFVCISIQYSEYLVRIVIHIVSKLRILIFYMTYYINLLITLLAFKWYFVLC